jgi:hypothetical protein
MFWTAMVIPPPLTKVAVNWQKQKWNQQMTDHKSHQRKNPNKKVNKAPRPSPLQTNNGSRGLLPSPWALELLIVVKVCCLHQDFLISVLKSYFFYYFSYLFFLSIFFLVYFLVFLIPFFWYFKKKFFRSRLFPVFYILISVIF